MRARKKHRRMSDINVTPFVDIMLVLLIIFMVTAPMLTSGIPIDLPKAKAENIETSDKVLDINIDAKGNIYIGSEAVAIKNLVIKISSIIKENSNMQLMISADRKASYGDVIETMGMIKQAGFTKIGLKTDANIELP